jgi:hypothetical protein
MLARKEEKERRPTCTCVKHEKININTGSAKDKHKY